MTPAMVGDALSQRVRAHKHFGALVRAVATEELPYGKYAGPWRRKRYANFQGRPYERNDLRGRRQTRADRLCERMVPHVFVTPWPDHADMKAAIYVIARENVRARTMNL